MSCDESLPVYVVLQNLHVGAFISLKRTDRGLDINITRLSLEWFNIEILNLY